MDEISLRQKEDIDKSRLEIADMLKRTHEQTMMPIDLLDGGSDESEDEAEVALEQLGERIAEGESVSINDLPKSLRDEFLRDISNGNAKNLIENWKPWWLMPESIHNTAVANSSTHIPCIRSFLASGDFQDVSLPLQCNSCLPYHCVEIAFFYCLSMRLYNGDLEESENEIAECIWRLSSVLSQSVVISSMDECKALLLCNEGLLEMARNEEVIKSPILLELPNSESKNRKGTSMEYVLRGLSDVATLFESQHFAIDALAHSSLIFRHCYSKSKRKCLFLAEKKCSFLTSYLRRMTTEEFWLLQTEVW